MPSGVATTTFANNPIAFSYVSNGVQFALNMPFVPSACSFWASTLSWTWQRGLGFGVALNMCSPTEALIATGGVLDVLDGSGVASTNVGTTTATIGLLIGTNTIINNGAGVAYRGLIYR